MKKIGNWWADGNAPTEMILTEEFTCLPTLEKVFPYVKKFDNAIDIGTWIGDSTVWMAEKFKNIIGFEANPNVFSCCLENLKDRNILNCDVRNIAVSNSISEKDFFNGKSNFSGWVSEKTSFDIVTTNHIKVNTITLDSLDLKDIDFIKIDVDSHEGHLLEGAQNFLRVNSPVILLENKVRIHKERQLDNMPNPIEILNSLGYTMIEKVAKHDFIFIKNEHNKQIKRAINE
jgi:FkbM family methyltransferase